MEQASQALQELSAGIGPGGAASSALMRLTTAAVAISGVHPLVKLGFIAVAITLEFIKWWKANKTIPQCKLIQGVPEEGGVVYRQQVVRYSREPYNVPYSHPTATITGIACVPVSAEIQSPEAEVTEGGINYKSVTIKLTPVDEGKWACDIAICAKPSAAEPDVKTGRADASSSATPAVAAPAAATPAAAAPATPAAAATPAAPATPAAATPAAAGTGYVLPLHWVLLFVIGLQFSFICGWFLRNVT